MLAADYFDEHGNSYISKSDKLLYSSTSYAIMLLIYIRLVGFLRFKKKKEKKIVSLISFI